MRIHPHRAALIFDNTAWVTRNTDFRLIGHDLVPVVLRDLHERLRACDACVVHQDRHRAKLGLDGRHKAGDLGSDGDVGFHGDTATAELLDLSTRCDGFFVAASVIDRHVGDEGRDGTAIDIMENPWLDQRLGGTP